MRYFKVVRQIVRRMLLVIQGVDVAFVRSGFGSLETSSSADFGYALVAFASFPREKSLPNLFSPFFPCCKV